MRQRWLDLFFNSLFSLAGFYSKEFMNFYLCDNIIPYKLTEVILRFKKYSTILIYIISKICSPPLLTTIFPNILSLLYRSTFLSFQSLAAGLLCCQDIYNPYPAHIISTLWRQPSIDQNSIFLKFHLTEKIKQILKLEELKGKWAFTRHKKRSKS